MNYYKRHIGDYAAATRHLSMVEHGAYTILMDIYYSSEAPLPSEMKAVVRKAGARGKDEIAAVESVLSEFFVLESDGWHQQRCDTEIAAMQAKAKTNKEVGKLGGRPPKKPKQPDQCANSETQMVSGKNPEETQTVSENNPDKTLATNPLATISSVPIGTGDESPAVPVLSKAAVWSAALSLLGQQGMPEPQARAFIGSLAKDLKDDQALEDVVRSAVAEQPADARAWLKATCQHHLGKRPARSRTAHAGLTNIDYASGVHADGTFA